MKRKNQNYLFFKVCRIKSESAETFESITSGDFLFFQPTLVWKFAFAYMDSYHRLHDFTEFTD